MGDGAASLSFLNNLHTKVLAMSMNCFLDAETFIVVVCFVVVVRWILVIR